MRQCIDLDYINYGTCWAASSKIGKKSKGPQQVADLKNDLLHGHTNFVGRIKIEKRLKRPSTCRDQYNAKWNVTWKFGVIFYLPKLWTMTRSIIKKLKSIHWLTKKKIIFIIHPYTVYLSINTSSWELYLVSPKTIFNLSLLVFLTSLTSFWS